VGEESYSTTDETTTASLDLSPMGAPGEEVFHSAGPFTQTVYIRCNAPISLLLPEPGVFTVGNDVYSAACNCIWTGLNASDTYSQRVNATGTTPASYNLSVDVAPNQTYSGPPSGATYSNILTITLSGV